MVFAFRKQFVDSRILGCGRHEVVQDHQIPRGRVDKRILIQIQGNTLHKVHFRIDGFLDDVVQRLPSFVEPYNSLWSRWNLCRAILKEGLYEVSFSARSRSRYVSSKRVFENKVLFWLTIFLRWKISLLSTTVFLLSVVFSHAVEGYAASCYPPSKTMLTNVYIGCVSFLQIQFQFHTSSYNIPSFIFPPPTPPPHIDSPPPPPVALLQPC